MRGQCYRRRTQLGPDALKSMIASAGESERRCAVHCRRQQNVDFVEQPRGTLAAYVHALQRLDVLRAWDCEPVANCFGERLADLLPMRVPFPAHTTSAFEVVDDLPRLRQLFARRW